MAHPIPGRRVTTAYKKPGSWAAGYHTGIDIAAPMSTKVYSVTSGKVVHVGWGGWGRAYGVQVIIDDGHGRRFDYCHLSRTAVRVNQRVSAGEYIGRVGSTGNSTGPHLHLEGRTYPYKYNNKIFNPEAFFNAGGINLSNLKYGKRHSDVKALQKALNSKAGANLPVTGYYGPMTDTAVRKHQKDMGMNPDPPRKSYVGPRQAKALGL